MYGFPLVLEGGGALIHSHPYIYIYIYIYSDAELAIELRLEVDFDCSLPRIRQHMCISGNVLADHFADCLYIAGFPINAFTH